MMSKSLSFKLVLDEARRNLWALALSVLGFLFAGPLPLVIEIQDGFSDAAEIGITKEEALQKLLDVIPSCLGNIFSRLGLMLMAVLCGIALFRFLHDRRQVDFYHALPIRRESLYAVKFAAGVLLVLPAYFAAQLITAAILVGTQLGSTEAWMTLLQGIGFDLLAFFTLYGISILCTVLCGNTLCAVALDGFVLFAWAVAAQVYQAFAYWFYPAYSNTTTGNAWMYCPALGFLNLDDSVSGLLLASYTVAGVTALILSFALFRIRRSERAGKAVAFEPLRLPLKVVVCLIVGMGFSCLLASIIGVIQIMWIVLFTAVGTAACHCVMEVIYDADVRSMFHHLPTLIAVTAASLLLTFGLKADVFGYSTWIPKQSSLEWMELYNVYAHDRERGGNVGRYYDFASDERLTDPTVVQALLRLAEIGVENFDMRTSNKADYWVTEETDARREASSYYDIILTYGMPGGIEKQRAYTVPMTEESNALLNTVLYSEDYLHWHSKVFRYEEYIKANPEMTPAAQILDCLRDRSLQTLHDGEQIKALIEALKADVLDFTPEQAEAEGPVLQMLLTGSPYRQGEIQYRGYSQFEVAVYPSYRRTLALLKEYAGIVPQPLRAEDIISITVYDNRERELLSEKEADGRSSFTVYARDEIEQILQGTINEEAMDRYGMRIQQDVHAVLMMADGSVVNLSWQAGYVPEELIAEKLGSELQETIPNGTAVTTAVGIQ